MGRFSLRSIRSILLLAMVTTLVAAPPQPASTLGLPDTGLSEGERVLHALNRLGFGPRPGEVERLLAGSGLERWILGQLHPEAIADREVDRRLKAYETLEMSAAQLLQRFPPPQMLRAMGRLLTTRMGLDEAAVHELFPELERIDRATERSRAGSPGPDDFGTTPVERVERMMSTPGRIVLELGQAKLIRTVYGERQLQELMTDFWFNHFNVFVGKGADRWWIASYERDAIRPHALGKFRDLLGATAKHPAMLFYLDNWLSTAPDAEIDRRLIERYASRAIRQQGLPPGGVATLILRDRGMDTRGIEARLAQRERASSTIRSRGRAPAPLREDLQRRGLNENYARELLELHTLGVDGGYTQRDIVELARCFTGWTLLPPHAGQGFVYIHEMHDAGPKIVLGTPVEAEGMAQGEAVLDRLARHPATARFVSTKLARRFVSDDPPAGLVDQMAGTFLRTDGDIREVLLTMIRSETFWSPEVVRAKVKTPLEYVVSLLRATDAELVELPGIGAAEDAGDEMSSAARLRNRLPGALGALRDLGMPLYGAQPPTGYADTADAWVSTGALMNRFKVGFAVAADRLPGVRADVSATSQGDRDVRDWLAELGRQLIGVEPSESTLSSLEQQLELPPAELEALGVPRRWARSADARSRQAVALLIASPEFQRR